jgi:hypothetical protein
LFEGKSATKRAMCSSNFGPRRCGPSRAPAESAAVSYMLASLRLRYYHIRLVPWMLWSGSNSRVFHTHVLRPKDCLIKHTRATPIKPCATTQRSPCQLPGVYTLIPAKRISGRNIPIHFVPLACRIIFTAMSLQ